MAPYYRGRPFISLGAGEQSLRGQKTAGIANFLKDAVIWVVEITHHRAHALIHTPNCALPVLPRPHVLCVYVS